MYETLMEAVVAEENCRRALAAVQRNQGAAGMDRMTTAQLEPHLQAHWWILKDKLLKGTYVPSPVRRVEIAKPSGGTRRLGIPTVQDRFIQQLLLQVLTPIFARGPVRRLEGWVRRHIRKCFWLRWRDRRGRLRRLRQLGISGAMWAWSTAAGGPGRFPGIRCCRPR
jgi:hypothetical protein